MTEAADLLLGGRAVTSSFRIRRAVVARPQRLVRGGDNKENLQPQEIVGPAVCRRMKEMKKKSPLLPMRFVRTPLRDITDIVDTPEWQIFKLLAAMTTHSNRQRDPSPEIRLIVSPLLQEPSVTSQTPIVDSAPVCVTACVAPSYSVENPLLTPSVVSSTSEIDPSPSKNKQTQIEEKLCRSIEQIEKAVKSNNSKKNVDAVRVRQRRTLMSMR